MRKLGIWIAAMAGLAVLSATACSQGSGTACPGNFEGATPGESFCLVVSNCFGGIGNCGQVICSACNTADGKVLDFNAFGLHWGLPPSSPSSIRKLTAAEQFGEISQSVVRLSWK